MRISKRALLLAVAAALFAAGFGATALYAAGGSNDTAMHAGSNAITNADCQGCHGVKANQPSLDPLTFSAHKRHLKSAFMTFQAAENGCGICHDSTDIWEGSGATVNRQVDVEICVSCHGGFTVSSPSHDGDLALTDPRGCLAAGCHAAGSEHDPTAAHGDAGYVNPFFSKSRVYCTKCHGGLEFYPVEETVRF